MKPLSIFFPSNITSVSSIIKIVAWNIFLVVNDVDSRNGKRCFKTVLPLAAAVNITQGGINLQCRLSVIGDSVDTLQQYKTERVRQWSIIVHCCLHWVSLNIILYLNILYLLVIFCMIRVKYYTDNK